MSNRGDYGKNDEKNGRKETMKKKIIALLLSLTMVAGLVGCGDSGTTSKGDNPGTENQGETGGTGETGAGGDTASGGDNSLTVWCWDPAFNIAAMEAAAEVYKQDHPDFTLNIVETPWEDVQTKLTTAATSGDLSTLPDILLMQDNAFQKNAISYPDAFLDLTNSGIDFSNFGEAKVAYSVIEGKNYGVPFDNGACIACYRTDLLEEAGLTVEDFTDITWSQYIELGKQVLEKTGKPLLSVVGGESDLICEMLQSAGASMFNEDGSANLVDNEVLQEIMEVYADLITSGVLIQANDWNGYTETITKGSVAGTINGCWILGTIQTAEDQAGSWAVTNMPKLEKAAGATNYSNNGGSSWAVTANCKNTELAYDFLASTFAGSVELYENILGPTGALATYLPAGDSEVYAEPQEFFGGEAIYSKITEYAGKVPSNITGVYYYEARDAVATAITNVVGGSDIATELQTAQDTLNFNMGN